MAFLEWSDSLSVKSRLLDTDHKRLIELINKLHDASLDAQNRAGAEAAIALLVDFTKTHFIHEETLMRKTAYPQFIPHKIEHDRLIKQIEDFRARYAAGQVGLSQDSIVFLRTWLCDHITKVDTYLGAWLAKHASLITE
ncbi:MAG: bacteriohemerythrin [Alphaproteobacteria bacterium]|nr:bacteriohemerythrin [Alphaproteobacteria bacterium]